jgi:hypothetical protein
MHVTSWRSPSREVSSRTMTPMSTSEAAATMSAADDEAG